MILAIGLEAAEPSLIQKFVKQGHLPTFSKLIDEGSFVRALSPSSISSGSTWASVNTGVNPAKHGVGFYHRQLENGTYNIVKKYADEMHAPSFWEELSRQGKRLAILDAPEIYPIPNFNGKIIAGWGGEALNFKRSSWPPSLLSEMITKHGDHPLANWYQRVPQNLQEWQDLLFKLKEGLDNRTAIYADILASDDWDLFYATIAETHWVGHFFWHMIDEGHPNHDASLANLFENSLLEIYQKSDDLIAKLMKIRPDAQLICFSNTGMGPNYSGRHLVPEILQAMGMTPTPKQSLTPQSKYGSHAIKKVEDIIGAKNIEFVKKFFPTKIWDKYTRRLLTTGHNWAESMAFEIPSDYTACIRINLEGREPKGIVKNKDYDRICQRISQVFLELRNASNGEPVVSSVLKIRAHFKGDNVDELPDLAIIWSGIAAVNEVISPEFGTFLGMLDDKRSGAHLPYGFIGMKGLVMPEETSRMVLVEDIAPTILELMGQKVPDYMDGTSLLMAKDVLLSE